MTLGASISGSIIGNDQILCGNVTSTNYAVTPMKRGETCYKKTIEQARVPARYSKKTLGFDAGLFVAQAAIWETGNELREVVPTLQGDLKPVQ